MSDDLALDTSSTVANGFVRSVLARQAVIGVVAFANVLLLAPWSLLLESRALSQLWATTLQMGAFCIVLTMLLSMQRMRESRALFQALALAPEEVEPEDVGALAALPFALTARFVIVGSLAATLMAVPPFRSAHLDDARAFSLSLLTFTIVALASVVHYMAVRSAAIHAIELSPLEPITAWLENEAVRLGPQQRVVRKVLLAAVAPVALVGVGAVLVAHAHLRTFVEESRAKTATQLVAVALQPLTPKQPAAGSDDALAAAAAHGFFVRPAEPPSDTKPPSDTSDTKPAPRRLSNGQLQLLSRFEGGAATVRYTAELAPQVVTISTLLALCALLLAAALGRAFGRALAADLVLASRLVTMLGTEVDPPEGRREQRPARFDTVAGLERSAERLAERFSVFARAQERALEAKASAQRMKQLLFASVSHDLKSPLNAILGFAELLRDEPLTQAQIENLDMVSGRGRELLALIETILDAARVEAGQLKLKPRSLCANDLVNSAVDKAFDLQHQREVEIVVEMAPDMPNLLADEAYAARALAVLIAHALETAAHAPRRAIRIRATRPAAQANQNEHRGLMARLHIEFVAAANRPSLLELQLMGKSPTSSGRGMVLRLSLARAIVELHGGRVDVGRGTHGAAVVTCWWPTAPSESEAAAIAGD